MAQVSVRIDDGVKADAEALFARLGLNLPTAIGIFIRQALQCHGLPFEVKEDPFYSSQNVDYLRKVSADYTAGRHFSSHDLLEVRENDE